MGSGDLVNLGTESIVLILFVPFRHSSAAGKSRARVLSGSPRCLGSEPRGEVGAGYAAERREGGISQ